MGHNSNNSKRVASRIMAAGLGISAVGMTVSMFVATPAHADTSYAVIPSTGVTATTTFPPSTDGSTTIEAAAKSGLAFTGADVTGTAIGGAVAIGLGGAVLLASRRRHSSPAD